LHLYLVQATNLDPDCQIHRVKLTYHIVITT